MNYAYIPVMVLSVLKNGNCDFCKKLWSVPMYNQWNDIEYEVWMAL